MHDLTPQCLEFDAFTSHMVLNTCSGLPNQIFRNVDSKITFTNGSVIMPKSCFKWNRDSSENVDKFYAHTCNSTLTGQGWELNNAKQLLLHKLCLDAAKNESALTLWMTKCAQQSTSNNGKIKLTS